jgi:hypothetical protein
MISMAEKKPRAGWEKAFKTQPDDSKSTLLIGDDIVNQFDKAEWDWEVQDRTLQPYL